MNKKRISLKYLLLFFTVVVTIMPISVLYLSIEKFGESTTNITTHEMSEKIMLSARLIDQYIVEKLNYVKSISDENELKSNHAKELSDHLESLMDKSSITAYISIEDEIGKTVLYKGSNDLHNNLKETLNFKKNNLQIGELYISEYYNDIDKVIIITTPIKKKNNIYYLNYAISIDSLYYLLSSLEESFLGIIDIRLVNNLNRTLVSLSHNSEITDYTKVQYSSTNKGEDFTQIVDIDEKKYIVSVSNLSPFGVNEGLNWHLELIVDYDIVNEPLTLTRQSLFISSFIIIFISILVAYLIGRASLKYLFNVEKYTANISKGNFTREINNDSYFIELYSFINSLDNMAKKIDETQKHLKVEIQEKEHAYKVKSMFLANMSHEIRTPMNAIIALTQMAIKTNLSTKQRELLNQVDDSSKSLLYIINDILDYSKIEAGKLQLEEMEFDLLDTLKKLSTLTSIQVATKNLELIFHMNEDVPNLLIGDSVRVEQILLNPINNAIKFTDNGEIYLHISVISKTDSKVKLLFSISDTGIGMTKEQTDNLFQEFSQADISTTRKYGGTGLGLSIAKKLSELMNGSISAISEAGVGSTFNIELEFKYTENSVTPIVNNKEDKIFNALVLSNNIKTINSLDVILRKLKYTTASYLDLNSLQKSIDSKDTKFDILLLDYQFFKDDIKQFIEKNSYFFTAIERKFILCNVLEREEFSSNQKYYNLDIESFVQKPVIEKSFYELSMICQTNYSKVEDKIDNAEIAKEELFKLDNRNILIAEDNLTNQLIIKLAFEDSPFTISIANDGAKAVEKTKTTSVPFDLILMDIQMPNMNGYDATIEIRKDEHYKNVPIIALTANVLKEFQDKADEIGMDAYITKPIDLESFYASLYKWLK